MRKSYKKPAFKVKKLEAKLFLIPNGRFFDSYESLVPIAFATSSFSCIPLPPHCCFVKGTKIMLANGKEKVIENIMVGDEVLSYSIKDKKNVAAKVAKLFVYSDKPEGVKINSRVTATVEHPFFNGSEWIEAGKLKLGDILIDVNGGQIEVTSIELVNLSGEVYNFEVENEHNYFAEGVLVHNVC